MARRPGADFAFLAPVPSEAAVPVSCVVLTSVIELSLAPQDEDSSLLNQAGSLVLTGVPAGLIGAYLRYTDAGKSHLTVCDTG
jgi:hypothetical protein